MKKYLACFLVFVLHGLVFSQVEDYHVRLGDTVYVSDKMDSYFICPGVVLATDLTGEFYNEVKINPNSGIMNYIVGNTVFVRANSKESITKTFFIKYDGGEWFGYLSYSSNPKALYDLRKKVVPLKVLPKVEKITLEESKEEKGAVKIVANKKEIDNSQNVKEVANVLEKFKSSKNIYTDCGSINGHISVVTNGIKNDSQATYLRFNFKNKSSQDYIIKSVYFEYISGSQILKELKPIVYNSVDVISGNTSESLLYALPKYSVSKKDKVRVHIIEENGSREIVFDVIGKVLSKY